MTKHSIGVYVYIEAHVGYFSSAIKNVLKWRFFLKQWSNDVLTIYGNMMEVNKLPLVGVVAASSATRPI